MCFDVSSETDVQSSDGLFHALAMPADDCSVEHRGGLGHVGDIFAIVELGKLLLGGELQ